ncbi:MAG: GDP-L-fucose synthase [Bacteriovoracaceae bacterium]|jgi:GDP-L-fucose synthase
MMNNKKSKILVLGAAGLVGTSLVKKLREQGYENIISLDKEELDLIQQSEVEIYFCHTRPDIVFFAAAVVGGIQENIASPVDFILGNLTIQTNVFNAVAKYPPKQFINFGSNCIYPSSIDTAISERQLLTGLVEETNGPYAIAKIAGIKTLEAFRMQFNYNFYTVIPANLYGPNDLFDSDKSHVISGIISRMTKAMENNEPEFNVWGSGNVLREFLYVEDLACACIKLMESESVHPSLINIGSGVEVSIKELVRKIKERLGYEGEILFDKTKPDGIKRKFLDSSYINGLGWNPKIKMNEGLKKTITWYQNS